MEKENVVNNKGLSSRKVWRPAGFRDLPSAKSLLNKEQQPYCMKQAEGPGQQPAGMTTFFNNNGFPPALVIPVLAVRARAGYSAGYKSGFTLIELLVVVLIIGILASVAVPQYNKAVIKSRYATIKALTASIAQAQEVYYLANGKYATDFEELSVEMPAGKKDISTTSQYIYDWGSCGLNSTMSRCTEARANMQFQIRFEHQDTEPGQRNCVAFSTDTNDIRNQICRQETKATTTCGSGTNYLVWAYQ